MDLLSITACLVSIAEQMTLIRYLPIFSLPALGSYRGNQVCYFLENLWVITEDNTIRYDRSFLRFQALQ